LKLLAQKFHLELNQKIEEYLEQFPNREKANKTMIVKIVIFLALWFFSIGLLYFLRGGYLFYIGTYLLIGFTTVLVIANIGHDASHGNISPISIINKILSFTLNLSGSHFSSWRLKHDEGHHKYTNIQTQDPDIDTGPILRLSPFIQWRWIHRYQFIYIFLIYPLLSLLLILFADFKVVIVNQRIQRNKKIGLIVEMILSKVFYIFYMLGIPIYFSEVGALPVLTGFIFMHFILGILLAVVFLPSHFNSNSEFYENAKLAYNENSWSIHQIKTTVDIESKNYLFQFFFGALNLNVLHHIKPRICHTHLFYLQSVLEELCKKYKLNYIQLSLKDALIGHYKHVRAMGRDSRVG